MNKSRKCIVCGKMFKPEDVKNFRDHLYECVEDIPEDKLHTAILAVLIGKCCSEACYIELSLRD